MATKATPSEAVRGTDTGHQATGHPFLRLLARGPVHPLELVGVGLLSAALGAMFLWVSRIPLILRHDESVYALVARHWVEGTPATGASEHRAPLLSVLGTPVIALGGEGDALRVWGLVAAIGALLAVWWLGRMIAGPVAGLVAATVFVLAPTVFQAGTQFLTDLPAAALLVALAGLLWRQLEVQDAPDRRLLLAAPLAWAAYELRYGSALVVVLLFGTAAVMFRRRIRRHPRWVVATLGLLVLLLVPHLVNSTIDMGSPWGRVLYTSSVAGRAFFGEGLVEYLRWYPSELAGPLAAALMTVGLVGAVVIAVHARRDRARAGAADVATTSVRARQARALTFLLVPAVLHVVAIGIASHGEPRFVFFAVALLCVAGGVVVTVLLRAVAAVSPATVVVALLAFAVVMAGQAAWITRGEARARDARAEIDDAFLTPVRALAERAEAEGPGCSVLTTYTPQVTWYSECASYHFGKPPQPGQEESLTPGNGWMLIFGGGRRQPEGEVLDAYLEEFRPVERWDWPLSREFGSATLYEWTDRAG